MNTAAVAYVLVALISAPNGRVDAEIVDYNLTAEDCAYVLKSEHNRGDLACLPDLGFDYVFPVKGVDK